jgi:CRP-like cAMP-binding protein
MAAPIATDQMGNNLLRALRPADARLMAGRLRRIEATAGTVLYEPGDVVRTVYFPVDRSLVSFMVQLSDGRGVETALIGREGAVGGIVSQGRLPAYARCVVQFAGPFYTIGSAELGALKQQSRSLDNLFARYADCMVAQIFQSVACNAAHTIEARTAKWLLAAMDRTGDREIPLTQEQLAGMLGVGRSYVSRVVRTMKERGVLETRRGRMRIAQLDALNSVACQCNAQVRRHFDDVLAGVYPDADPETLGEDTVAPRQRQTA